jgi:hypothetical protein
MRYLRVDDDASVADIEAAITELLKRQRRTVLEITFKGIEDDIEELWDRRAIALLEAGAREANRPTR